MNRSYIATIWGMLCVVRFISASMSTDEVVRRYNAKFETDGGVFDTISNKEVEEDLGDNMRKDMDEDINSELEGSRGRSAIDSGAESWRDDLEDWVYEITCDSDEAIGEETRKEIIMGVHDVKGEFFCNDLEKALEEAMCDEPESEKAEKISENAEEREGCSKKTPEVVISYESSERPGGENETVKVHLTNVQKKNIPKALKDTTRKAKKILLNRVDLRSFEIRSTKQDEDFTKEDGIMKFCAEFSFKKKEAPALIPPPPPMANLLLSKPAEGAGQGRVEKKAGYFHFGNREDKKLAENSRPSKGQGKLAITTQDIAQARSGLRKVSGQKRAAISETGDVDGEKEGISGESESVSCESESVSGEKEGAR